MVPPPPPLKLLKLERVVFYLLILSYSFKTYITRGGGETAYFFTLIEKKDLCNKICWSLNSTSENWIWSLSNLKKMKTIFEYNKLCGKKDYIYENVTKYTKIQTNALKWARKFHKFCIFEQRRLYWIQCFKGIWSINWKLTGEHENMSDHLKIL